MGAVKQKKRIAISKVSKLSLQDGDVIVVHANGNGLSGLAHLHEEVVALQRFLVRTGRPNCTILLLGKDASVDRLTPEDMRELGWFRLDS